jgi:hypothetical protein
MDQKNAGTIKIWSVVVGVLSLSSLTILAVYPLFSFVGLLSAVAIILGLATAYAGLSINSMNLKTVNGIFWAKFVWLIVNLLFSLTVKINFTRLLIIVAQGVIVWFLIESLKRVPQAAPAAMK